MGKRILIVEDHQDFLEVMTYLLQNSDQQYTLLTAHNGREGLEKARSESPDLILTDIWLPECDGYELCKILKQDPQYAKIPVVIWSASKVLESDAQLAKVCGADVFLQKTAATANMLKVVKDLLAGTKRDES